MDWGSVVWLLLAIVGAASIAGGVVAYRRGGSVGQTLGAASVAAGVAMWAIILVTVPMSTSSGDSPAPIVVTDQIPAG